MANKSEIEALKAVRRMAREQEIKLYGKSIRLSHIVVSKKVYSRKRKHAKQFPRQKKALSEPGQNYHSEFFLEFLCLS